MFDHVSLTVSVVGENLRVEEGERGQHLSNHFTGGTERGDLGQLTLAAKTMLASLVVKRSVSGHHNHRFWHSGLSLVHAVWGGLWDLKLRYSHTS